MTMVVGLINDDDETAYREVRDNLSFNISKTKELNVDYRKWRAGNAPIHIDGAVVEQVESFKFLGVHITKELSWSTHINTVVKRARQCLLRLRRLKRLGMGHQILKKLHSFTIGCVLGHMHYPLRRLEHLGCITA